MKRALVIGGGVSGLAAAFYLQGRARAADLELEVKVLEKEDRPGGKIWSIKEQGYLCEWGPNGFLDSKPQTLDLCADLGISKQLLRSNDNARKRYIFADGILHRLPESGPSFFASKLISWPGKIRLAMEPFAPGSPAGVDETLAAFGRRRLGHEALQKLISPMVSGIFAGDPETMSLKSCFPRIAELESEYGGLVKAMLLLARKKRRERAEGKVVSSPSGPGGILTSFREGLEEITASLAEKLGAGVVATGQKVLEVNQGKSVPYRVRTATGELEADLVVVAAPSFAAAAMLRSVSSQVAEILEEIPYASMTIACFGYEKERIGHNLDGFGYLIPKVEGMSTLGTLWDSSIFENRAPEGHVLLRSMLGGACFPEYIELPDDEIVARVEKDLGTILGIQESPEFTRVFRHEKAIPQYTVGHGVRLKALEENLCSLPGLMLTGNSYRGISLNDCVASAVRTADEGIALLKGR
ncbi:MAG: protoporphyrinogen oxidase [Geobacter sp.]|nr:MAG: protoporphyrinogen oxidase [Geobacter sp.]